MRKSLIILMIFNFCISASFAAAKQEMIKESKHAIKDFAGQLKSRLMEGMTKGGPVTAIQICNQVAGDIGKQVSEKHGWKISRTSLKPRNTKNAPDAWEASVLQSFEKRKLAGEDITKIDYAEILQNNGRPVFRYMKAIPTQGLCLSCHGDNIPPDVSDKLWQLYPDDKAKGFKIGDIRGAFSIIREIK